MKNNILTVAFASVAFAAAATAQTSLTPANFPGVITDPGDGTYNIVDTLNLGANGEYTLELPTFVVAGGEFIADEGTIIRAQPEVTTGPGAQDPGMLIVTREGYIECVGTSTNPVIFTSLADSNPKAAPLPLDKGQWGALVLLGNAPINTGAIDTGVAGEAFIEGVTADARSVYGGTDVNDNSGIVRYVSIRYSGRTIIDGDEIQGLTTGGVGAGTTLEFIEIFGSDDDGIEIFGGTTEVKNLLLVGHDDDGFDGDHGWQGTAQFVCIVNSYDAAFTSDHAIELDGDDTGDLSGDQDNISADGRPFASGHLTNFTIIGFPGLGQDTAVRFRRGFGGSFTNSIITGFDSEEGLELDNNGGVLDATNGGLDLPVLAGYGSIKTADRVRNGSFIIAGTTWYNVNGDTAAGVAEDSDPVELDVLNNNSAVAQGAVNNLLGANPQFGKVGTGFFATNNGDVLLANVTAGTFNPVPNPSVSTGWGSVVDAGNQFDAVGYRGAFPPAANLDLWTTGWTALNVSGILVSSN